jgi:hypothetical protein
MTGGVMAVADEESNQPRHRSRSWSSTTTDGYFRYDGTHWHRPCTQDKFGRSQSISFVGATTGPYPRSYITAFSRSWTKIKPATGNKPVPRLPPSARNGEPLCFPACHVMSQQWVGLLEHPRSRTGHWCFFGTSRSGSARTSRSPRNLSDSNLQYVMFRMLHRQI